MNSRLVKKEPDQRPLETKVLVVKKQTISAYGVFHLQRPPQTSANKAQAWCSGQVPQTGPAPDQRAHAPGEGLAPTQGAASARSPTSHPPAPPASTTQADDSCEDS